MTCLQRRPTGAFVAIALALGLAAPGCRGGEPAQTAPGKPSAGAVQAPASAMADYGGGGDAATTALLASLDRSPTRVVRAIAVLRPGPLARSDASAALKAAGASTAQDLGSQPMLVIEVNAAQLRALLRTGQVLRVQLDSPAPTN